MKKISIGALTCLLAFCGCSIWPRGDFSNSAEKSVRTADVAAAETKTLAGLSEIEDALREYYSEEKRIPENLDTLVPRYLPEIPEVELGIPAHRDTNRIKVYPSSILVDGVVDGARIADTGGWGYAHTDRQIVVFVDCTHLSSTGAPWYSRQP